MEGKSSEEVYRREANLTSRRSHPVIYRSYMRWQAAVRVVSQGISSRCRDSDAPHAVRAQAPVMHQRP